jgi:hypothetical protein
MYENRITCEACGTRPDEWEKDPEAYTAILDRCQGCREIAIRRKEVPDGEEGIRVFLTTTDIAMQMYEEGLIRDSQRNPPQPEQDFGPTLG